MSNEFAIAHDLISSKLLLGDADSRDCTSSEDGEAQTGDGTTKKRKRSSRQKKRPRPRYAICKHCDEEFDVTSNGDDSCAWHDCMRNNCGFV